MIGNILNTERKNTVQDQMKVITDLNELQIYSLMTDVYGDKMACIAFKKKLQDWDKTLWDLGLKLESYRVASEEFQKDPFYKEQKRQFNENQVLYLMFLTKVKKECNLDQPIITFFYQNAQDCRKCDDQSFILTDIKLDLEDEVSVFSFDMDLNITNIELLKEYYGVEQYPCIVINEKKYCGIQDKAFIMKKICPPGGECASSVVKI
ncbi:MAG: hypothetical protein WC916_03865 [Candidatus Woesearchaeota archaeon]